MQVVKLINVEVVEVINSGIVVVILFWLVVVLKIGRIVLIGSMGPIVKTGTAVGGAIVSKGSLNCAIVFPIIDKNEKKRKSIITI